MTELAAYILCVCVYFRIKCYLKALHVYDLNSSWWEHLSFNFYCIFSCIYVLDICIVFCICTRCMCTK